VSSDRAAAAKPPRSLTASRARKESSWFMAIGG
jgi:hypothetical protein